MIIDKYNQRVKKINSLLCVGLDVDFEKIPEKFKSLEFPQFEFNKWIYNIVISRMQSFINTKNNYLLVII